MDLLLSNFIKFSFIEGLSLCRLGERYPRCRAIAGTLGGFGGMLPQEKFQVLGSQRLILIPFTPFHECVQSLVASPFTGRSARSRKIPKPATPG